MGTSDKTSLGDRMKSYEFASKSTLPPRTPVIIRVDGKAFHTYTKGCQRPFDDRLIEVIDDAAIALCNTIQGAQVAYVQSDEISILVHSYKTFSTQSWFGNEVQKIVSISASTAAAIVTANSSKIWGKVRPAAFDSRVFVIPESEVCNYFLWRQQDATRNSIQMLARSLYSHKECDKKNGPQLQEMCFQKGTNWNDLKTSYRRGRCIVRNPQSNGRVKWEADSEIPKFSEDRNYINKFLTVDEE